MEAAPTLLHSQVSTEQYGLQGLETRRRTGPQGPMTLSADVHRELQTRVKSIDSYGIAKRQAMRPYKISLTVGEYPYFAKPNEEGITSHADSTERVKSKKDKVAIFAVRRWGNRSRPYLGSIVA